MSLAYTPVMSNLSVLAQTRQKLSSLTPSEQAVARAVLERPSEVLHWSVEETTRQTGVSTATVMRFCRTIGCEGFRELKLALAAELGSATLFSLDVVPGDTPSEIARKVILADLQAIRDTLDLLDMRAFTQATELLAGARRIEAYGIGSSAPIAFDAYYRLLRIGLPVGVATDAHVQAVSASLLRPGDVALVISHTGRTTETLSAAGLARKAGASVVGITSYQRTPLTELCDVTLVTATAETSFRTEAMASRIAHLSVIDALYVALAAGRVDSAQEQLERTQAVIESKRVGEPTERN